ncbi:MAG: ABC transporter ATP-binding protein [Geminicoccaceae bacterium]
MTDFQPNLIPKTGDDRPAKGLYSFLWRMSGYKQVVVVGLALIVAGLTMAPLELQRRIIDDAIRPGDMDLLLVLGGLYIGTYAVLSVLKLIMRMYQSWLSESAVLYGRRHLASLVCKECDDSDDGGAASIVTSEADDVGSFVGIGLSDPAVHLGTLVAITGYMLWVEPVIALVSFGFLIPQVITAPLIQRKINALVETRVELLRNLNRKLIESDGGPQDDEAFGDLTGTTFNNRMNIFAWKFAGKAILNLLNALAPISVLIFGGWMVIQGNVEIGVVVAFMTGFQRLADPLRELVSYYRMAAQTSVKHDQIAAWM